MLARIRELELRSRKGGDEVHFVDMLIALGTSAKRRLNDFKRRQRAEASSPMAGRINR